jgi:hypothetical protein
MYETTRPEASALPIQTVSPAPPTTRACAAGSGKSEVFAGQAAALRRSIACASASRNFGSRQRPTECGSRSGSVMTASRTRNAGFVASTRPWM